MEKLSGTINPRDGIKPRNHVIFFSRLAYFSKQTNWLKAHVSSYPKEMKNTYTNGGKIHVQTVPKNNMNFRLWFTVLSISRRWAKEDLLWILERVRLIQSKYFLPSTYLCLTAMKRSLGNRTIIQYFAFPKLNFKE